MAGRNHSRFMAEMVIMMLQDDEEAILGLDSESKFSSANNLDKTTLSAWTWILHTFVFYI